MIKQVDDQINTLKQLVQNAIFKETDLMLLEITRQNYVMEYETFVSEYKSNIYLTHNMHYVIIFKQRSLTQESDYPTPIKL